MGALRTARSGGGKTNATKQAIERGEAPVQFSGGHAAEELKHTTTATVSIPSARQLRIEGNARISESKTAGTSDTLRVDGRRRVRASA